MNSQTPLWSVINFPDLNRRFEHALYCREVCSPTLDKLSKVLACANVVSNKRRLTRTQLFLSRIMTGVESCIYGKYPEIGQQSSQWKSPQSPRAIKKGWEIQSSTKSMFTVVFKVKGHVHCKFIPRNTPVSSDLYCDILRHLRGNMGWKRLKLWHNHKWLHHSNVPTHTALKSTQLVTNNNIVIISNPPYLPDLIPCDFTWFPNWKWKWRDRVLKQCLTWLTRYFWSMEKMDCCICSQGDCFEGGGSQNRINQHFFFDVVQELANKTS